MKKTTPQRSASVGLEPQRLHLVGLDLVRVHRAGLACGRVDVALGAVVVQLSVVRLGGHAGRHVGTVLGDVAIALHLGDGCAAGEGQGDQQHLLHLRSPWDARMRRARFGDCGAVAICDV